MVKSYCVRQKKQTECLPNSEQYVYTKNNRLMLKCICSECNIIKTRFVSNKQTGRGVGETINKKIGDKIPGFQQAQDLASAIMGVTGGDKKLFDKYWSGNIAKGAFNKKKLVYFQRNSGAIRRILLVHAIASCLKMENGITNIVINI